MKELGDCRRDSGWLLDLQQVSAGGYDGAFAFEMTRCSASERKPGLTER